MEPMEPTRQILMMERVCKNTCELHVFRIEMCVFERTHLSRARALSLSLSLSLSLYACVYDCILKIVFEQKITK